MVWVVASRLDLDADNAAQAALPVRLSAWRKDPSPHGLAHRMDAVQQDPCNNLGEVGACGGLLTFRASRGGGIRAGGGCGDRAERDERSGFGFGREGAGHGAWRARGRGRVAQDLGRLCGGYVNCVRRAACVLRGVLVLQGHTAVGLRAGGERLDSGFCLRGR